MPDGRRGRTMVSTTSATVITTTTRPTIVATTFTGRPTRSTSGSTHTNISRFGSGLRPLRPIAPSVPAPLVASDGLAIVESPGRSQRRGREAATSKKSDLGSPRYRSGVDSPSGALLLGKVLLEMVH